MQIDLVDMNVTNQGVIRSCYVSGPSDILISLIQICLPYWLWRMTPPAAPKQCNVGKKQTKEKNFADERQHHCEGRGEGVGNFQRNPLSCLENTKVSEHLY